MPHQTTIELAAAEAKATVTRDPHRPGRDRVRLEPYGIPVWALIAHLQGVEWDASQTGQDYGIPEVAVRVAIDHYRGEPKYIDAFLLLNRSAFDDGEEREVDVEGQRGD